jgi:hypothetical protein
MNILAVFLMTGLLAACGVVGTPVAPEDVGVSRTIARQKQQHALEEKQRATTATEATTESDPTLQGQDDLLPPLQPVGTR